MVIGVKNPLTFADKWGVNLSRRLHVSTFQTDDGFPDIIFTRTNEQLLKFKDIREHYQKW